jgi:RNA polymerase sigma-B factor
MMLNASAVSLPDSEHQPRPRRRGYTLPGTRSSQELFLHLRTGKDRRARELLIRRYLPLAHRLARRYSRSSEPQDDLKQVASLALVKAVDRFDPTRGDNFVGFAVPTILGELKRYFRDATWAVHVPRRSQERALAMERASEAIIRDGGRAPTVNELAEKLQIASEEVLDGLQAADAHQTLSLDAPQKLDDEGTSVPLADTLGSEDERYELIEDDATIAGVIADLPKREREILHLRFVEELTQSQIAKRTGVSQMHVSRLLRRSIADLRDRTGADESA